VEYLDKPQLDRRFVVFKRRVVLVVAILALIVVLLAAIVAAAEAGVKPLSPVREAIHYPWSLLADEASTRSQCVKCHKPEDLHTCGTCHDAHGGIEMSKVPFDDIVWLLGDVPKPGYIRINEILPYVDQPNTSVTLLDFLAKQGVEDWESITLASLDGALVTVDRANITTDAVLLPHMDGLRFAAPNLHISTWIKGISRITVVGKDTPLTIDGQATSIGRVLLGPSVSVTVEETDVMLKSPEDGQIRKAKTASRLEGAPLDSLVAHPGFQRLVVRDKAGREHTLSAEEAAGAVLVQTWGQTVLVLPARGRGLWIADVVQITSQQ
jgi:hypothetical protein